MNQIDRRNFLKKTALGAAGVIAAPIFKGWENVFAKNLNSNQVKIISSSLDAQNGFCIFD
jgi:hypothetical protein